MIRDWKLFGRLGISHVISPTPVGRGRSFVCEEYKKVTYPPVPQFAQCGPVN